MPRPTGRPATWRPDNDDDDDDGDGLDDEEEVRDHGTDPAAADTDWDGLDDGDEVNTHGTNPLTGDSDGDCLSDYEEVVTYGSNPLSANGDGDDWCDVIEVAGGTDPNDPGSVPDYVRVSFQPAWSARPDDCAPSSPAGYNSNLGYGWHLSMSGGGHEPCCLGMSQPIQQITRSTGGIQSDGDTSGGEGTVIGGHVLR